MTDAPRLLQVTDVDRGTVVGDRIRLAHSFKERLVGLLATPELEPGSGLWIEHAQSIHMFFMRYAIDAVFVNAEGTVVRIEPNLRPWRVVLWAWGSRDCIELPVGAAAAAGIEVGDRLVASPTPPAPPPPPGLEA